MKKILFLFILFSVLHSARASDTLTIRQIYNFDVGDTFDYHTVYYVNAGPSSQFGGGYFRFLILSKTFSPDSDAVTYTRSMLYPPGGGIDTIVYVSLDSSILYIDTPHAGSSGYQFSVGFDTNNLIRNTGHFVEVDLGTTRTFIEGLGKTYSQWAWGNITEPYGYDDTSLIYYTKGNISRGTPYYERQRVGLMNVPDEQSIHLYPNPTSDILRISLSDASQYNARLIITDLLGQEVYTSSISESETIHDISRLASGLYTWRLVADNGILKTGKIILQ